MKPLFIIIILILAIIVIPIFFAEIHDTLHNRWYHRHLIRLCKKEKKKALFYKDDLEFYLRSLPTAGSITIHFPNADETYDFSRLNNLYQNLMNYLDELSRSEAHLQTKQWHQPLPYIQHPPNEWELKELHKQRR